jgi:ketosteroid isomerase-like protein
VTEWAAAFNRQDAAGAAALYHEDATNIQLAEGEPVRLKILGDVLPDERPA